MASKYDQPRQHIKKQRHYFADKGPSSQNSGFSSSHVWMWELDYKVSWVPKNWCFWTVVLEKTLESTLDCKEIQSVHPKRDQPWVFIGRTDVEAETPILWPPDVKNWLTGKDPDTGKDWRWEEKGTTEDEVVGWHHQLDGHEFQQAPGIGGGQGKPGVLHSMGRQESDMTERLNNNKINERLIASYGFPYFNWRLIILQYCSGLLTWISHGYMCPPTSLPIPSLKVVPMHRLWVPCFMYQTWTGHLFHIW